MPWPAFLRRRPANPAYWHDKTGYPHLNHLMGAYFNQDYDTDGATIAQIVAVVKRGVTAAEIKSLVADIDAFLATNGRSDTDTSLQFERVFQPEISVDGWEGLSTRQWLLRIAELLQE